MHINIKTYKNLLYLWFIIEVSTDRHFWFYFYPFSSMQVTRSTELARKTPKMCSWCWVSVMSGKYQGCAILIVIFLEAGTPSIGINISIVCWPNFDNKYCQTLILSNNLKYFHNILFNMSSVAPIMFCGWPQLTSSHILVWPGKLVGSECIKVLLRYYPIICHQISRWILTNIEYFLNSDCHSRYSPKFGAELLA